MFENLDDPTPPSPSAADRDAVEHRAAAIASRRRRQRILVGVGALIPIVAVALVVALAKRNDDQGLDTLGSSTTVVDTTTTVPPTTPTTTPGVTPTTNPPPSTATTITNAPLPMQSVTDIDATTAASVWAVGYEPCGADQCVALAHSTDGGRTWGASGVPAGLTRDAVGSVRFGSANDGYLFGPQLWVTHDGGAHWSQATSWPASWGAVLALEPEGADVWAVVSTCSPGQGSSCQLEVIESADSGASWTVAPVQPPDLRGDAARLVREADGHAWVVTDSFDAQSPARLAATADAGSSWHDLPVPCTTDPTEVADVAVVDPSALWFACGSDFATVQEQKQVFSSSDGGATWAGTADPGLFAHLASIAAPSASTVFMGLARGGLVTTTKTASKWTDAIPAGDVCDSGIARVLFIDPSHGWAAGSEPGCQHAMVWRTDDGGATWRGVPLG
jgi:photosystem II stability/assembly factor-like uncharacterized protein